MTPYWTGSTPKRRARAAAKRSASALTATEPTQEPETAPAPVRDADGPQNAAEGDEGER